MHVREEYRLCVHVCVSMLTAAQHCDPGSHVQIQGCSERVANRRTDAAHQRQEPQEAQRRGSSSPHLRRAPHGTARSLRPGRTHH